MVEILNRCFDIQAEIVRSHDGDIDKFVGDSLVALFEREGMEVRAVSCGLEIQAAVGGLLEIDPGLRLGMGIASGEVVLGAMGAKDRMDFTVLGRAVNLAARLCGKAQPGEVLVSSSVRDAALGTPLGASFVALEPIALKGYIVPVQAFAATVSVPTRVTG